MTLRFLLLAALCGAAHGQQLGMPRAKPVVQALRLDAAMDLQLDLAGVATNGYPHFTNVAAFNQGSPVWIGIDTGRHPELAGHTCDVYVTPHRTRDEWVADPKLVDVAGGAKTVTPTSDTLAKNVFEVDAGMLIGETGTDAVGVGYDVVLDYNQNGVLDHADRIDGWADVAGFYVMPDLTLDGPYETIEVLYNGGRFKRQNVYYPAEIASLGERTLVVISHGNGHNYTWYDHLGYFLSSWGYVVMSHENNTGPGIETASTTTLRNTNHFLQNLGKIAGGVLKGRVDSHSIVWMGHSRGGEGVARAYNRLVDGDPIATVYTADDVKLVSSIAPTDFLGVNKSDPLDVPFHLWTGGADADVTGCADNDIAQTFHLHERARGERMSISLHGVGHGDFHDGGGSSVAAGPCQVGRDKTHRIMKGYALPLIKHVLEDNVPCKEYLWRQWESLRPIGAPQSRCVVVDLMYQEAPEARGFVLDDFQTGTSELQSSSGGRVEFNVVNLSEGELNDRNNAFTDSASDAMNGMTSGGPGDDTRGVVFEWSGEDDRFLLFEVREDRADVSSSEYLSFRAAQCTRHPLTTAERQDLDFTVQLFDRLGNTSRLRISSYGGGIEEPYQRRSCGKGKGWANEWETIRIPLEDFRANGRPLDLSALNAVAFRFGPSSGSAFGRIGLDEIEFTAAPEPIQQANRTANLGATR